SGRGLVLVGLLAARCTWEPSDHGKRVWAEIVLPTAAPAIRAAVLRKLFELRLKRGVVAESKSLILAVA
ncbi:ATP-binding protein, partial [Streptomyces prasinus]